MKLAEQQRLVRDHVLGEAPSPLPDALPRDRWALYRSMVRGRFHDAVKHAYPRTREALGVDAFRAHVDTWLDTAPPRSRLFWELSLELGDHLVPTLAGAPHWAAELAALERARWEVRHAPFPEPPPFVDIAFERVAVVNPAMRLVHVTRDVDGWRDGSPEPAPAPLVLAVYRNAELRAATHRLNPLAGLVLEGLIHGEGTVTEVITAAARIRNARIDEAFVAATGALLADFLENGILLGARPD